MNFPLLQAHYITGACSEDYQVGLYYNCFSSTDCTFHDVTDYLFIPYFVPSVCTVPVNEINGENSSRQELLYIDLRKRPRGKESQVKNR